MVPQKCIERQCPRYMVVGGHDVCVLHQVGEKDEKGGMELAVLDVFNVKDKVCRKLREELKETMEGSPKPIIKERESPRD